MVLFDVKKDSNISSSIWEIFYIFKTKAKFPPNPLTDFSQLI